jgi:hypothetical protein
MSDTLYICTSKKRLREENCILSQPAGARAWDMVSIGTNQSLPCCRRICVREGAFEGIVV